jgi:hypothetical protein
MKMTIRQAKELRQIVIKQYTDNMPPEFYKNIVNRFDMGDIDKWSLTIEEIQNCGFDSMKIFYAQIEKLIKLMGVDVSPLDVVKFCNKQIGEK